MAVDEGELLLGGVQVAGEGGGGQAGAGEEDRGGTGGRSGILAEVVAEPAGCQRLVEPAGDLGEQLPEAGGCQGQGADGVIGDGRLAQPALVAGEPVQAADCLGGGAGPGVGVAGDVMRGQIGRAACRERV